MKERPILFSGEMVRAILAGRKTQTRRVIKPQPVRLYSQQSQRKQRKGDLFISGDSFPTEAGPVGLTIGRAESAGVTRWMGQHPFVDEYCPFGIAGDRLWVRETFTHVHPGLLQSLDPDPSSPSWETVYRADANGGYVGEMVDRVGWKPSIFMPRSASRMTLEIVGVRVERLQEITDIDAEREGMDYCEDDGSKSILQYRNLWDSLNAKRGFGWSVNPWVWALEFRRVMPNELSQAA